MGISMEAQKEANIRKIKEDHVRAGDATAFWT